MSKEHLKDTLLTAIQFWAHQVVICRAASSPSHCPTCTAARVVLPWVQDVTFELEEGHLREHQSTTTAAAVLGGSCLWQITIMSLLCYFLRWRLFLFQFYISLRLALCQ